MASLLQLKQPRPRMFLDENRWVHSEVVAHYANWDQAVPAMLQQEHYWHKSLHTYGVSLQKKDKALRYSRGEGV